ncbi:MAG: SBBP repeat-containing protein [Candidatus Acidiferrum sp.]
MGIAADASGFAYVTGQTASDASTTPFPTTTGAYQTSLGNPNGNAFLTVLNTNWSGSGSLLYSTYLGGNSAGFGDYGMGVAVDDNEDAFITGQATSGGSMPFPTTFNAYQTTLNSIYGNVFIAEIAIEQSGPQSLVYSTYMGGSSTVDIGDSGSAIALDPTGNVYVDGDTSSSDFPVTSGAFQTTNSAGGRAFVARLNLTQNGMQSLIYSSYLGGTNGSEGEVANGIAVDANGNAFASGSTSSSDFPTTSGAYQTTVRNDLWNVFLTQMNSTGTGLLYSTYLGGSCSSGFGDLGFGVAVDSVGNAYIDGSTCSSDFPISSNAYQTSLAGAYNAFLAKFAMSPNPGITASLTPRPNASGWNNSPVTVSFTCIPAVAPIQSCSSPVTVSTEGANQAVSGTATDTANNTGTTSATINLDMTPPTLSITSPSSGAVVSTPYVAITGTATDALSGVANVSCNNVPASLSGSNFACTVPLSSVSNSINVVASDLAGNWAMAGVSVTVSMGAPTSLQITPANSFLVLGATQSFTAIDQTGTSRPDASWSVSNPLIANFVSGSSNSLTGIAAGQVTLTATVGSVSGQTTVTVLSGSSLTAGTVLWSATPVSGFTAQQILQAAPTVNGPDLFSIETDSNGNYLVRAFRASGEQMWQNFVTQTIGNGFYVGTAVGDNSGGILVSGSSLVDLNAQTGVQNWQYSSSNNFGPDIAVGPNGTVYMVEQTAPPQTTDYLDVINGSTGALLSQIPLPSSSSWTYDQDCFPGAAGGSFPGRFGPPTVGLDGTMSIEVELYNSSATYVCNDNSVNTTYSEALSLLQILPNGATRSLPLSSYSQSNSSAQPPFNLPGDVIPDGNGGVLASWVPDPSGYAGGYPISIADIGPQGGIQNSSNFPATTQGGVSDSNMVLGDRGTAFVTDGDIVVSFSPTTLQQNWTYTSTSNGNLSFVAATSGGGAAINDDLLGVIQLDPSGNASAAASNLQGATPYEMWTPASSSLSSGLGLWTNASSTPTATFSLMVGEAEPLASSIYAEPASGPQKQRSAIAIPVHIKEDLGTITQLNGNAFLCGGEVGVDLGNEGYAYCATLTVLDKNGSAINNQQFRMWETIQKIASYPADRPYKASQGVPAFPDRKGLFYDTLGLNDLTASPQIGEYFLSKQFLTVTDNLKSYSSLRINCQFLVWNKATVTDVTSTPYTACQ